MNILEKLPEAEIIAAVRDAGALLDERGAVHEIHAKTRTDFVTDVDVRVQETLAARLAELLPEVQFMGEEQDNSAIDVTRPFWVLDPVDGTTNLIRALRHSAVSLGLCDGGAVVFGVVFNPYADELFTARLGGGAYMNGRPIHVTRAASLAESLVYAGTAPGHREWTDLVFRDLKRIYERSLDLRRSGCASLDICDVACGRLDAYEERYLCPWDYAAGSLIVAEAGGRATNCDGAAPDLINGGSFVCSNGLVHDELLELLK